MTKFLSRFLLCLMLLEVDVALAAPAGVAQRLSGEVWIYSKTLRARHLKAGEAFESGVSISTSPKSSVVLRFQDGQIVALAPNSTFRVKNFAFSPTEPGKGQVQFELVKGGMRSVTGSAGESNRTGWQLETPSAMVTISGTDFFVVIEQGLYAHVNSGAVTLANDAGALSVPAGGTGFAAGEAAAPLAATTVPQGLFDELQAIAAGPSAGGPSGGGGAPAAGATGVGMSTAVIATALVAGAVAAAASGSSDSTTTHH